MRMNGIPSSFGEIGLEETSTGKMADVSVCSSSGTEEREFVSDGFSLIHEVQEEIIGHERVVRLCGRNKRNMKSQRASQTYKDIFI